jgi:protein OS-9
MVKETSTCSYLMIVDTPRLCNDVAFTPPQENVAHSIVCEPVVAESEVESWTAAQEAVKLAAAERLIAAQNTADDANTNPLRDITKGLEGSTKRGPIIGGIEVGAKKLVGSEGKVIEKSLVVGGGKESYIVVASSDGKQMSKEEMKKHDIVNLKDVETFKNTLKKKAGKKGWKLVLADTRQGRELRGIIETEDEVSEKKKSTKKDAGKDRDEESVGMGKEREKKQDARQSDEEETHEGSEEVYKDEL